MTMHDVIKQLLKADDGGYHTVVAESVYDKMADEVGLVILEKRNLIKAACDAVAEKECSSDDNRDA